MKNSSKETAIKFVEIPDTTGRKPAPRRNAIGDSVARFRLLATIAMSIAASALCSPGAYAGGGTTGYSITVNEREAVLFPFDRQAIPYRSGVQLSLVPGKRHKDNPVIRRGGPGAVDSMGVALYGTIIQLGGELRMWYLSAGTHEKGHGFTWLPDAKFRVAYAVSTDGISWTKPNLGLVEYAGHKNNNLVKLDPMGGGIWASVIIHEPEDPRPERRFKMIYEAPDSQGCSVAYSADGLIWANAEGNPLVSKGSFEPSGLIKWNGHYHATGQGGGFSRRVLVVHSSRDFEKWTEGVALGFRRDGIGPLDPYYHATRRALGPQVHLGASLTDRGNVILGQYGQWHGPTPESNDRRDLTMDIGLLVSHDGLNYHEPIPGFKLIDGADEHFAVEAFRGRLVQSQGLINVGEQTMAWYSMWGPHGADGVYLATWVRDRLGYYSVPSLAIEGQAPREWVTPQFVSCPIRIGKPQARVFLNAEFPGEHSHVTIELLDDGFREIPEYSGANAALMSKSGLREPVQWGSKSALGGIDKPVRLRVSFGGLQSERAKVYAIYVE